MNTVEAKVCKTCGQPKPIEEFQLVANKSNPSKQWRRNICEQCRNDWSKRKDQSRVYWQTHKAQKSAKDKRWYERHKDEHSLRMRKYRKDNSLLCAIATQRWAWENRLLLIQRLGNECVICGKDDPRSLQVDHIEPAYKTRIGKKKEEYKPRLLRLSDEELKSKYQLLCANCNAVKKFMQGEYGKGKRNRRRKWFERWYAEKLEKIITPDIWEANNFV